MRLAIKVKKIRYVFIVRWDADRKYKWLPYIFVAKVGPTIDHRVTS